MGQQHELESEYEDELPADAHMEAEEELEGEYETDFEDELESLLGQGEAEVDSAYPIGYRGRPSESDAFADHAGADHEGEDEEFFRGLGKGLRGVGRFVRRGAKVLRPLAKVAAPLVGAAIGGPFGGLAGTAVSSLLEGESEFEGDASQRVTAEQVLAEAFAARAAASESEAEAEALIGAAAATVLSRRCHASLRAVHADLVRGAATLAQLLHRHRATRPYTGVVPTIVDRAAATLARHARRGHPVTRRTAAQAMATHTARVFGDPRRSQQALLRHVHGVRQAGRLGTYPGQLRSPAVNGAPVDGHLTGRSRGSTLQVVTPVRVPAKNGRPARLVRVITNVRVPHGAVPAARTAVVRQSSEHD